MCELDECTKPIHARRLCAMHYYRAKRNGTTGPGPKAKLPAPQRFARYVVLDGTDWASLFRCWSWSGRHWRDRPRFTESSGVNALAYRWVTSWQIGRDLTADEQAHHLCGNRRCVNPMHLVPLTRAEHDLAHGRTPGAGTDGRVPVECGPDDEAEWF